VLLCDLNQIAARVVENGRRYRTHVRRRLRETDADFGQSSIFGRDVIDAKRREGYSVLHKGFLERPCCGVLIGFKEQFDAVGIPG
jgi:hypothetical protein